MKDPSGAPPDRPGKDPPASGPFAGFRHHLAAMLALALLGGAPVFASASSGAAPGAAPVLEGGGSDSETASWTPTLELSLPAANAYMFRGENVLDGGLELRPELTFGLERDFGEITAAPYLTLFASTIHGSAVENPEWLDELDFAAGIRAALASGLDLDLSYQYYHSPARSFADIHELGLIVTGPGRLAPHAAIFRELKDGNGGEETYLELGVEPTFTVTQALTIALPLALGASPDGYYRKADNGVDPFGFVSTGVQAAFALTAGLSLQAGVDWHYLLAASLREGNDGRRAKLVVSGGLTFGF